jgi:ribosomal protein L37E
MGYDVMSVLDHFGHDYKNSGKNVAAKDINICCPFCGEQKYHLGIRRDGSLLYCWSCGFVNEKHKPSFIKLFMELEQVPYKKAFDLLQPFYVETQFETKTKNQKPKFLKLPEECQSFDEPSDKAACQVALNYLKKRGFDETHIDTYNLKFCSHGYYAKRIIIPMYLKGELVNFTARSYVGDNPRYLACRNDWSLVDKSEYVYGVDDFEGDECYLVEGPTDKWRLGFQSLALMTNKISHVQKNIIISLGIKELILLFDYNSYGKAFIVAEDLSPFINRIKIVELGKKDVADCKLSYIHKKINETFYQFF